MPVKKKPDVPINLFISVDMYPYDVMVSINETDDQLIKNLKNRKVFRSHDLIDYNRGAAKYVVWYEEHLALIRLPQLPRSANDYAGLMHEILHIVIDMLRSIGMRLSPDGASDEAYTYFMSYLVKHIFNNINKYY